jgi:hypothetical protein
MSRLHVTVVSHGHMLQFELLVYQQFELWIQYPQSQLLMSAIEIVDIHNTNC